MAVAKLKISKSGVSGIFVLGMFKDHCPPPTKDFEIWETWSASVAYAVVQGEAAGFEIKDVASGATAVYVYAGAGLVIGLPKIPKVGDAANKVKNALSTGGATTTGPPNKFTAPGYLGVYDFGGDATMQTPYNLALGTDKSFNIFDFGGNVDNKPGFLVHIDGFSTGRTFSLPSSGISSGSMALLSQRPDAVRAIPVPGRGKFGGGR